MTRFFLVRMPERQTARHDASETTELAWLPPDEAIDRCRSGQIMLPPPTWTTLKQLGRFDSIDDLFAWADATPIVRVQPNLIRNEQQTLLTLPGGPNLSYDRGFAPSPKTRDYSSGGRMGSGAGVRCRRRM